MRELPEPPRVANARDRLRAWIELARRALVQDGDGLLFDRYYRQAVEEALAELGEALHEAYPPRRRRNGGN